MLFHKQVSMVWVLAGCISQQSVGTNCVCISIDANAAGISLLPSPGAAAADAVYFAAGMSGAGT
jgi:hypothetical protein